MGKRSIFAVTLITLAVSYAVYAQKMVNLEEVTVQKIARLPIGSRERELILKVLPDGMVLAPKLLPPDANGFWILGEAKGGIMRINRSGTIVTVLRPQKRVLAWPSVNSFGYIALHLYDDEITIYSPNGQKVGRFRVKSCPQCGHSYCQTMIALDDKERVWLQFLSTDRSIEEEPKRSACVAAFDLTGKIVQHIEGVWGGWEGRLWQRTKSIGGSFIVLKPETMETTEIPVPAGWDGLFIGMDLERDLIWWRAWRLDNPKVSALIAFDKRGIAAMLPRPQNKDFIGVVPDDKIVLTEAVIGTDGQLYITQCGELRFYILEVKISFLRR